jgi:2-dehydropantoate 2-reductase
MTREPLLIVGTGAMACLFGARLAPVAETTLLGSWPEGLAALRAHGIELEEGGRRRTAVVRAVARPEECVGARLAIVLVKSWQTAAVARQLETCLARDGIALTLQNGLGNLECLQERLGKERAVLGVTTLGATLLAPGRVRAGGDGPIYLTAHSRLEALANLLRRAGLAVETIEDVDGLAWGKLVVNAAINPVTALLRVPNGELLNAARAGAWEVASEAAVETAAVATARGVCLPFAGAAAQVAEVARRTAANRSSMLQDVERGRPTEIDAINGAVVSEGERLGIPTPVNRILWKLVRSLAPVPEGVEG